MKKFLLFISFLISLANGYSQNAVPGSFRKEDQVENFWTWFKENEMRLRNFESDPAKYLGEISEKTKKIRDGLAIELEPPQNGVINMTISADGVEELFPVVESIVSKAPAIRTWKFIAFRQRMPADKVKSMILKADNHELDPNKMKFYPVMNGNALDIIVFVAGVTENNYNEIAYGGLLLLDNLLGEYDCVKKVRSYDFHAMPAAKEELADLKPLLELPKFVDDFHATKRK
jgi:hypothetical protein